jgi:hypothetical protein
MAAAPASTRAADPTGAQYQNGVNQIEREVGGGGGQTSLSGGGSNGPLNNPIVQGLPFTGLDLFALAAVAIALVSLLLALRRLTIPRAAQVGDNYR